MDNGSASCESTGVERLRAELAAAQDKIAHLEVALKSNRRIGTAVGVVMSQHRVTEERAFAMLIALSQRTHRKIRDLAEDVLHTGDLPG